MPRRQVPLIAGQYYHLYNRGNNRNDIAFERDNYLFCLGRFRKYVATGHTQVIAYVLMPNHYHVLLKTLDEEVSAAMQKFSISYTKAINERFDRVGSLFQGAFKAKLVDNENYLRHLSRYIHLNPVRARLCVLPEQWEFSSYLDYIGRRCGTDPEQTSEVSETSEVFCRHSPERLIPTIATLERDVEDVLETVRKAQERQKKCCLLIGAGCSVKAGVPLASGFVDIIKDKWAAAYARAREPKHYPQCMAELPLSERRDLIAEHVDKARINGAHMAIAQLMKHGYVDCVLTTNFDPLVVRACAMVGHYPAVYDFAASQVLKPADIPGEAVFYLHGQRNGFVLMNTDKECKDHAKRLKPLFQDAGQGRVWIVVGYSGENDPVFKHLASVKSFDDNLYWIGYQDNEPARHVRAELLRDGKYAFHVKGFDADDFFVTLTQRLGCFPPRLISEPFSHLDDLFNVFTDYKAPQQYEARDITAQSREMIRGAIGQYEQPAKPSKSGRQPKRKQKTPSLDLQVTNAFMAGDYDKVIQLVPADQEVPPELIAWVSGAYVQQGVAVKRQAMQKSGAEADRLFVQAGQKCLCAEELTLGGGAYNLACISALQGRKQECRTWLEKSREHGKLPSKEHLRTDTDLDSVRDKDWFKSFIDDN